MRRITIEVTEEIITETLLDLGQRQRALGKTSRSGKLCDQGLRAIRESLEKKDSVVATWVPGSHVRSSEL